MAVAQWPTVSIQAAFSTAQPGYPNVMVLDNVTSGLLDTDVLGGPVWTDISADVRSFSTSRGRSTPIDRFQPGQVNIELDNMSGNYDSDNLAGAFVMNGASQVQPLVPVRITATWAGVTYPIFYGYASSWTPLYTPGASSYQTCTLVATDAMDILSQFLPAVPSISQGAGETTDARIARVLNNAGWSQSLRLLDPGNMTLAATTLAQAASDDIQSAVDAELGRWYITGDGLVAFERRYSRIQNTRSRSFQAIWADKVQTGLFATNIVYSDIQRSNDYALVRNLIQGQRDGGTLEIQQDLASQAVTQGPRTYNATSLELTTDNDVDSWCQLVRYLWSQPESRINSVTFQPLGDPTNLWPECLGRLISDQVLVFVNPAVGSTVAKFVFVEGIAHTVTTSPPSWMTTFQHSSATKYEGGWFLLDDPSLGVLDTSTLGG